MGLTHGSELQMGCWPVNNSKDILCTSINPHSHYLHCDSNNKQLILCSLWYTKLCSFCPSQFNELSAFFRTFSVRVEYTMFISTCTWLVADCIVIYQLHRYRCRDGPLLYKPLCMKQIYHMDWFHHLQSYSADLLAQELVQTECPAHWERYATEKCPFHESINCSLNMSPISRRSLPSCVCHHKVCRLCCHRRHELSFPKLKQGTF